MTPEEKLNHKCCENCVGGDKTIQYDQEISQKCAQKKVWYFLTTEMETKRSVSPFTWLQRYSVNTFSDTRLTCQYTLSLVLPVAIRERRSGFLLQPLCRYFHHSATRIISNDAMSSTTLSRAVKPPLRFALYKTLFRKLLHLHYRNPKCQSV